MQEKSLSRNVLCLLATMAAVAQSQTRPAIKQSSEYSPCSNIIALAGNADIKCSSLTSEQQKKLDQIPGLLRKILANQIDVLKLDELLKAATQTVESNQGVIFQQNSGGLNIQQGTTGPGSPIVNSPITIGHVPKSIPPEDMTSLVGFLKTAPVKGRVLVTADQVSGLEPFPDDFYKALKNAGWDMVASGVEGEIEVFAAGATLQGVQVHIKGDPLGPNERIGVPLTDPIAYVAAALDSFKIPRILVRDQGQPEGLITIEFIRGFANH